MVEKNRWLMVLMAVVVSGVILWGRAFGDTSSLVITSRITKAKVADRGYREMNHGRIGQGIPYSLDPVWNEKLVALYKDYGFTTFRFHWPHLSHWGIAFEDWAPQQLLYGKPITRKQGRYFDARKFARWMEKHDFRGIIQLNASTYFDGETNKLVNLVSEPEYIKKVARRNAALVQWFKDNGYLARVYYWEIGNENYGAEPAQPPELYAQVAAAIIRAIRQVDPAGKICIVGQAPDWHQEWEGIGGDKWNMADVDGKPGWIHRVLLQLKKEGIKPAEIDFVAHHAYGEGKQQLQPGTRQSAADIPPVAPDWQFYRQPFRSGTGSVEALAVLLERLGYEKTMIEVNEFRRGGYDTYYSRAYVNALGNVAAYIKFIKHPRVSGALIWDAFNGHDFDTPEKWSWPSGWGIFMKKGGNFYGSPTAKMHKLIAWLVRGEFNVLDVIVKDSLLSEQDYVAVQGEGKIKLLLVNKLDKAVQQKIVFEGFKLKKATPVTHRFLREKLDTFTINASTGKMTEVKVKRGAPSVAKNNSFNCRLESYSINYFEVEMASGTGNQR